VALVNEVLYAQARPQSKMVLLAESEDARNRLTPPRPLFVGDRGSHAAGCLKRPFDDFLGRAAQTPSKCRFQQLLPMG